MFRSVKELTFEFPDESNPDPKNEYRQPYYDDISGAMYDSMGYKVSY